MAPDHVREKTAALYGGCGRPGGGTCVSVRHNLNYVCDLCEASGDGKGGGLYLATQRVKRTLYMLAGRAEDLEDDGRIHLYCRSRFSYTPGERAASSSCLKTRQSKLYGSPTHLLQVLEQPLHHVEYFLKHKKDLEDRNRTMC
jgi:hypothetical protein